MAPKQQPVTSQSFHKFLPLSNSLPFTNYSSKNIHLCPQDQIKHYEFSLTLLTFSLLCRTLCQFSLLVQAQSECPLPYILFSNTPHSTLSTLKRLFQPLTMGLCYKCHLYVFIYTSLLNY